MNDDAVQNTDSAPKPPPSAWAVFGATLAVIVSSVIAFFCTCFPTGLVAFEILGGPVFHQPTPAQLAHNGRIFTFSCAIGIIVGLFVGYMVFRYFRKIWSNQ